MSPIVKFYEFGRWKNSCNSSNKNYQRDFLRDIFKLQGIYEINVYKEKKFKKDRVNLERIYLLQHLNYFLNKKNPSVKERKKIIDLINVEKFAVVFAINSLFHDWHSVDKENIRFYLNPFNLKIEPIPTDFSGQNYYNNYGKYKNFQEFKITTQKLPKFFSILYENKDFQNIILNI